MPDVGPRQFAQRSIYDGHIRARCSLLFPFNGAPIKSFLDEANRELQRVLAAIAFFMKFREVRRRYHGTITAANIVFQRTLFMKFENRWESGFSLGVFLGPINDVLF